MQCQRLVLLASLLGACVAPTGTERAAEALRAYGAGDTDSAHPEITDPCHIVFTCHGIFWDLGAQWDPKMHTEVRERGAIGLGVTYFGEPFGVWFGYGSRLPGAELARMADAIHDAHAASGCPRPLVLDGVGFSLGGEALLHAARSTERARFRRIVLVHSSTPAFGGSGVRTLIAEGRIHDVLSMWSPIDIATLFAPLGAGQFGLRLQGPGVENRRDLHPHGPMLLGEARRREVLDALFADARPAEDEPPGVLSAWREQLAALLESL